MKSLLQVITLILSISTGIAQTVQSIEVYEISAMKGQQIYYASHIKAAHMKSSKLMDDEDRAAVMGAMGNTGIAMPRFSTPYVDDECRMQECKMTVIAYKNAAGETDYVAKNKYNGGEDNLIVFQNEDVINCVYVGEGVIQIYTIHKNVTFPDGAKLVTSQTTRNRPLGVSTMNVSGKATRVK
jgi:hypothetical protein